MTLRQEGVVKTARAQMRKKKVMRVGHQVNIWLRPHQLEAIDVWCRKEDPRKRREFDTDHERIKWAVRQLIGDALSDIIHPDDFHAVGPGQRAR